MQETVSVTIDAPRADVWAVVTAIEDAATTISAVERVEIIERPERGILGLKWKETRTVFGKSADETIWFTAVDDGTSYATEARSHGSVYRTLLELAEVSGGTLVTMTFSAQASSTGAKVLSTLLGPLIRRSVGKALRQDLLDVKATVESRRTPGGT